MRKRIHVVGGGAALGALIAALVLAAGPATAQARGDQRPAAAEAALLAPGAGYGEPRGSQRVRALQRRLRRAEQSPGPVDGRFGPLTEAAVRAFQAREGLVADGLVGTLTTAALRREAALLAPGAGYGDPRGSQRVRALQRRLRRAEQSPGPVDGRFGALTEAAVRAFQARAGIPADGLVGRATRVALAKRAGPLSDQHQSAATRDRGRRAPAERPAARRRPESRPERRPAAAPGQAGAANQAGTANQAGAPSEAAAPSAARADADPDPGWDSIAALAAALLTLGAGAAALAVGLAGRRRRGGPEPERGGEPAAPEGPVNGARGAAPGAGAVSANGHGEPPVLGYALISATEAGAGRVELGRQAEAIAGECRRRGLGLLELVRDREPRNGGCLERPGLGYALRRIAAGEARGLVVAELAQLCGSASDLGELLDWFGRSKARLVVAAQRLDTGEEAGLLAARALIEVSGWERERLRERTQKGLEAARSAGRRRGRAAVADDPELRDRIAAMRAAGMTLQSIADRLNEQGVPTVRGGAMWRPSSVQAAAGYKRRPRARLGSLIEAGPPEPGKEG